MQEVDGLIEQREASIRERDAARQGLAAAEASLADAQAALVGGANLQVILSIHFMQMIYMLHIVGDAAAAQRAADLQVPHLELHSCAAHECIACMDCAQQQPGHVASQLQHRQPCNEP